MYLKNTNREVILLNANRRDVPTNISILYQLLDRLENKKVGEDGSEIKNDDEKPIVYDAIRDGYDYALVAYTDVEMNCRKRTNNKKYHLQLVKKANLIEKPVFKNPEAFEYKK